MIKINLCPVDELENPYWYVADVAAVLVVMAVAYIGVQQYLDQLRQQLDDVRANVASLQESTKQLEPELKHFENLNRDIAQLNEKLAALSSITTSKIAKYKPVVALEHLQNLKPDGLWFDSLSIGVDQPESFQIRGQAFDNILVAEFMTGIRATESQEFDPSDIRTQVYLQRMQLEESSVTGLASDFPELTTYPSFSIRGMLGERVGADVVPGATQNVSVRESPEATVRF